MPNVRSCLVSFTDTEGIEHSVRIAAETLYEAAIEAMAAFRRGAFAEMTFGPAAQQSQDPQSAMVYITSPRPARSITGTAAGI